MARMKDLLFDEPGFSELEDVAHALRGEVDGKYIQCPSPGRDADDRSMCVRVNPRNPQLVYVYYCEGPLGAAYAYVRKVLGIQQVAAAPSDFAQRVWEATVPGPGTLVEVYLRSRGIKVAVPQALRFHPSLKHSSGSYWPGMVAGVFSDAGQLRAIHRTFLRRDGVGKAPIDPDKMTLGPIGGGGVRLAPVTDLVVLAEGIETALSVIQAQALPTWAALSAPGLKAIRLPSAIRRVIVAADGDQHGLRAAHAAVRRFNAEGRIASIAAAPPGKDFNDLLRAEESL